MTGAAMAGFLLGGSLIIAIGAQNAFILRQGLVRSHVFVVCLIAAISDALLIAAGVAGLGTVVARSPVLISVVTLGGALFLFGYAVLAFRRALHPHGLEASSKTAAGFWAAVTTCLALTFLNPHVYLDTVLLIGGLSGGYEGSARLAFGIGAGIASFVWFFGLGYGARLLAPIFVRPVAWRILDIIIGLIMAGLAVGLLLRYVNS
ncbi:LysE/ArgO family amino acid transporter [Hoeflea poritis]|uniref:LysE/ArgO family amino acid transporter n=1 Tax=Hoeflea poritis TaxID=2993659 RepID=A0ABT4VQL6_9HYPH|nr:LysE/ArgO family amino acid transporter [Hoeflea poritis]MDA4846909.1 LysE/ArgO family amino acid transporter [Hoeflea poritis]